MTALLTGLWSKVQLWAALLGAVIVAVGIAFLKGRTAGKEAYTQAATKADAKLKEKYDEIDMAPADLDGALGRLRDRASRD